MQQRRARAELLEERIGLRPAPGDGAEGRPVAVLVKLDRKAGTKSGYAWSSADGPPFTLTSMTLAEASIRLADQRPVDWLLP